MKGKYLSDSVLFSFFECNNFFKTNNKSLHISFFNPVLFPMYLVCVLVQRYSTEILQFERTIIYFNLFFKWLRIFNLGFFFKLILDLMKSCKYNTECSYTFHPESSFILCNCKFYALGHLLQPRN